MRVLIVGMNYQPEPTGIAPYTSEMAEQLAARGHAVRVLTTFPHYPEWRFTDGTSAARTVEERNSVEVVRLRHRLPRLSSAASRVWSELWFGARAVTTSWKRADVIVVVSPALFASAVVALRARLSNIPVVAWVQDLYGPGIRETGIGDRFGLASRAVSRVEAALLTHAAGVVAIHERMADEVESMGVRRERISAVRNWSHVRPGTGQRREHTRADLGWESGDVIVLHTGNMGIKQDLLNVVEAARLAGERGSRVRFVLMGDGQSREDLEDAGRGVDHLQIRDGLPEEQYLDALRAADILLINEHPSLRSSALPSKLTSYFASGRPVLAATDERSLTASELRTSGAGRRVQPGNPLLLLKAAERLSADPAESERLARRGLRYRETKLSTDAAARSFVALLKSVRPDRKTGSGSVATPHRTSTGH